MVTAGAGIDVMTIGGGLVSAGFGAGGGTRLMMVVPTIISDGTATDLTGGGGAGVGAEQVGAKRVELVEIAARRNHDKHLAGGAEGHTDATGVGMK